MVKTSQTTLSQLTADTYVAIRLNQIVTVLSSLLISVLLAVHSWQFVQILELQNRLNKLEGKYESHVSQQGK